MSCNVELSLRVLSFSFFSLLFIHCYAPYIYIYIFIRWGPSDWQSRRTKERLAWNNVYKLCWCNITALERNDVHSIIFAIFSLLLLFICLSYSLGLLVSQLLTLFGDIFLNSIYLHSHLFVSSYHFDLPHHLNYLQSFWDFCFCY